VFSRIDGACTLGLSAGDILPAALDAPDSVINERIAIARALDAQADNRLAALRATVQPGRELNCYDLRYIERSLATLQRERAAAAALRRFHLRDSVRRAVESTRPAPAVDGCLDDVTDKLG
jgi:hypothetical protein